MSKKPNIVLPDYNIDDYINLPGDIKIPNRNSNIPLGTTTINKPINKPNPFGYYSNELLQPAASAVQDVKGIGNVILNLMKLKNPEQPVPPNIKDTIGKGVASLIGLPTDVAKTLISPASTSFNILTDAIKKIPSIKYKGISIGGKEVANAINLPFEILGSLPKVGAQELDKIMPKGLKNQAIANRLGVKKQTIDKITNKITDFNSLATILLGMGLGAKVVEVKGEPDIKEAMAIGKKAINKINENLPKNYPLRLLSENKIEVPIKKEYTPIEKINLPKGSNKIEINGIITTRDVIRNKVKDYDNMLRIAEKNNDEELFNQIKSRRQIYIDVLENPNLSKIKESQQPKGKNKEITSAITKQPYEMTIKELANQKSKWYKDKQYRIPLNKFKEIGITRNYAKIDDEYNNILASGNLGDKVPKELLDKYRKEATDSHRYYVEKALSEGKKVPDKVLKDYPDLAGNVKLKPENIKPSRQPSFEGEKKPSEKAVSDKPKVITEEDYMINHRPDPDGSPSYDLAKNDAMPSDVYTHPEYYIGESKSVASRQSITALRKIKGKPDANVTVYRSSPKNEINSGDWVSFSKEYAKQSGFHPTDANKDLPVHSFKVKAKDIKFAGDDLNEFGYFPQKKTKPKIETKKIKEIKNAEQPITGPKELNLSDQKKLVKKMESVGGYLSQEDVPVLQQQFGNIAVIVKDVNGQRASMNINDFIKLSKNTAFSNRIRDVFINDASKKLNIKPNFNKYFMEALQPEKLLRGNIEEPIKNTNLFTTPENIKLSNSSTISSAQQNKFIEMITDPFIRKALDEQGIKEINIQEPYKFSLSEQANIIKNKKIININADATNPKNTILHELGHAKFEDLPKQEQNKLIKLAKQTTDPSMKGYKDLGKWDEIIAENLFNNPAFFKEITDKEGITQTELFQKNQSLSSLSKEQLDKEIGLVNKLLGKDYKVKLDNTIIDEDGNPTNATTNLENHTIKINPDLANTTTMMHEIVHRATNIVLNQNPRRGKALLKLNGWDLKGDPFNFNNKSTVKAWENIAKKGESYFTDEKKFMIDEPRAKWYKDFFDKVKQIWESAKNYFKKKGFISESKFYDDLIKGKFKDKGAKLFTSPKDLTKDYKINDKRAGSQLNEIKPEKIKTNKTTEVLANNKQKSEIHILAKNLLKNRAKYEELAFKVTGKKSAKDMTEKEANDFINVLKGNKSISKIPIENLNKEKAEIFDNFINLNEINIKKIDTKNIAIRTTPKGNQLPAIRKTGFYAPKELETAPIRDIYRQTEAPHHMALMQDNYKKGGKFGIIYKKMWLPVMRAIASEAKFKLYKTNQFKDILKIHDYKITKRNMLYLSDIMEGNPPDKYKPLVKDIREFLDKLRNDANFIRTKLKKELIDYRKNYIPHMQKTLIWNELLNNKATISDNLSFVIPNEAKNPAAYKRMLEELPNAERNFGILMDRYIDAAAKDIYISPSIEHLKVYNSVLKNRGLNKSAKYWDEYIRTGLVGKQSKIDEAFGIGVKGRRALVKWNIMLNHAFLTGNIAWNLSTQPLSLIMLTPMEAGYINTAKAILTVFKKGIRDYAQQNSESLNIKSIDILANSVGEGRNYASRIYRTKINKWNDAISLFGDIEEQFLHKISFIAGLSKAKELRYKGQDAIDYADLVAQRTQSMYNRENRALILNSDLLRAVFPFNSFSIEMFNHEKEILTKNKGAMQLNYRQRFGKLFYLAIGIYLSNKYSQFLTGRKKTGIGTFIPFVGQIANQFVEKATGNKYVGTRSPITFIQIYDNLVKSAKDYLNYGSLRRLRKFGLTFGLSFLGIGGGSQLNNIIDGINADIENDVKSISNKKLFNVTSIEDKIKAPIFGIWSAKGAQEYFNKPVSKEIQQIKDQIKKVKELKTKALEVPIKKYIIEYKREKRNLKIMEYRSREYQLQKLRKRINKEQENKLLK